jgi:tetratricopeptide (TPR) repeat protein
MKVFFYSMRLFVLCVATAVCAAPPELEGARDRQDRAAIEKLLPGLNAAAQKQPNSALAQYRAAEAQLYMAEVALELRDKAAAARAAQTGIPLAQRATELEPSKAEYHRILGALCGQVIPANVLAGIQHGKCAIDAVNKAMELDPKSALVWMSRGVGNYYLPAQFGGGTDKAVADLRRATQLNPKLADAWLWLGIALRKSNRNVEARQAFSRSLELNPNRVWTREQLDKTPAQ